MTDSAGSLARLTDRPIAGPLIRYWIAAAYESHRDRDEMEWMTLALVAGAIGVCLALGNAALLVTGIPQQMQASTSVLGALGSALYSVYQGLSAAPIALASMYVGKLGALVIDQELAEGGETA